MGSISSANSTFALGVTGLYAVPQPLMGFDVDDAFDSDSIDVAEIKIGVDGLISAGFVFATIPVSIHLQADSPSISLFEAWYTAERAAMDKFTAFGTIVMPSVNKVYTLTNGILSKYSPMASNKKVLAARSFTVTFESIIGVSA